MSSRDTAAWAVALGQLGSGLLQYGSRKEQLKYEKERDEHMNALRGQEMGMRQQEIDVNKKQTETNLEVALLERGFTRNAEGKVVHDPELAAQNLAAKLNETQALTDVNTNAAIQVKQAESGLNVDEMKVKTALDMDATAEKFIYQDESDRNNFNRKAGHDKEMALLTSELRTNESEITNDQALEQMDLKAQHAKDLVKFENQFKLEYERAKASGGGASSMSAPMQAYTEGLSVASAMRDEGKPGYEGLSDAELRMKVYTETLKKTDGGADYTTKLDEWSKGLVEYVAAQKKAAQYGEEPDIQAWVNEYTRLRPRPVNPFAPAEPVEDQRDATATQGSSLFDAFNNSPYANKQRPQ